MHPTQLPFILTLHDAALAPLYFIFLLLLITWWRKKYYQNSPLRPYIIPGLVIKLLGTVVLAMVYHFKYGYGDMFSYFTSVSEVWNASRSNPRWGFELIFRDFDSVSAEAKTFASMMSYTGDYFAASTEAMMRIAAFIGLLGGGTYLPTAFIIATLCFWGYWQIFETIANEFPKQVFYVAIGCLFIPSTIIWGGGILKDPLCMFGVGLYLRGIMPIIYKKKIRIAHILLIALGSMLLIALKEYILACLIPPTLFVVIRIYGWQSPYPLIRRFIRFTLVITLIGTITTTVRNSEEIGEFLYDNFASKTEIIQGAITQINQEDKGSAYTIPNVNDYSPIGILQSFVLSLNVTLFRPYLWEINNPISLVNALESTLLLLLTCFVLLKGGWRSFGRLAKQSNFLLLGILFTLLLAPLIGFISFNFGTLVRYKLPLVPFYYTYILLLWATLKQKPGDC